MVKGSKMKPKRQTNGDIVFNVIVYGLGILIFLCVAYPLYFVVIASISDPNAVMNGRVWLYPKDITFEGYARLLQDNRVWMGYRNTILYTIVGTFISLAATIPAGYALSRKDLVGRRVLSFFFTFTMFFGGGLIPTFLTVRDFGLYNTFWALVVPFCVSVYNLIITRTFFATSLPQEMLEAAQIDGCSNTRYFFQIALPLSTALLAVIGLYYAVGNWNQYFLALIYLRDSTLQPLQIALRAILLQNKALEFTSGTADTELQKVAEVMKYALIIVASVPILVVYPFIQKYFNQGVMIGAVKG